MRTIFVIGSFIAGGLLISFSRSFWIGLVVGFCSYLFLIVKKDGLSKAFLQAGYILSIFSIGFVIILADVKFPFPKPVGGFDAASLLYERASDFSSEAAVSSRWALLPELRKSIMDDPVIGKGFGASVTYRSSDPRVLSEHPDGMYTTYAFEWGWLDIWLKLGFFGFISYVFLLGALIYKGLANMPEDGCISKICRFISGAVSALGKWFPALSRIAAPLIQAPIRGQVIASVTGLVVIAAVNFFTPYLNHPLGIGFVILSALTIENSKQDR